MEMIYVLLTLFLLLFTSTPVGIAIYLTGFLFIVFRTDIPLVFVGQVVVGGIDKFSLLAVLFFLIAGNLLTKGTVVKGLVGVAKSMVGFLRGGLSMSSVVACGLFGSVTGSNVASLAAVGGLMIPSMKEEGYGTRFSTGLMTSNAILGVIIPPSIPMIIYCSITNASIGKLFLAGVLPGILIIVCMCLYCYFYARTANIPKTTFPGARAIFISLKEGFFGIMIPVIIFGGIYTGVFTATEASVVATVYAYVAEIFILREMSWKEAYRITIDACVMTGVIMFIVVGAQVFGNYLSLEQVPVAVTRLISENVVSPGVFICLLIVFFLLIGMVLELVAAMLIITPVLMPSAAKFGIDPIHFGMVIILGLAIGFVTPPIGLNLYVASSMTGMKLGGVIRSVLPFILILTIAYVLVCFFPGLSLWLPNLLLKG
ncbi:MAG: TRAP transporter large permease [Desulfobacteraceae bacterium]|jgi:C4-dicarboxylate transporter DctM subunit